MLDWQKITIPFAAGLQTKADPRALEPPALVTCKNAQFTETGGIQKRYPYTALGVSVLGGGSASNLRRIHAYGDQLLLFTKDKLYSRAARDSAWVERATYLAPKISEKPLFAETRTQDCPERAELSNVIFYAWEKSNSTLGNAGVYVAALDKATGAVLLNPTALDTSDASRPRMVVLTNKVLIFWVENNNNLRVKALDPANIASSVAVAYTQVDAAINGTNPSYDVAALTSTTAIAVWKDSVTTSYGYASITEAPVVTASTKARTCDGPIGVAVAPDGKVAVVRANGTNIQGDILTSALVDSSTAAAVGTVDTAAHRISCGFRSVQNSSQYRCYAYWTRSLVTADNPVKYNYVDTAGNVGSEGVFVYDMDILSKAFDYDGSTFVWVAFARRDTSGTQDTAYLYRDDGLLVSKALMSTCGLGNYKEGWLPSVQNTSGNIFSMATLEKRVISTLPPAEKDANGTVRYLGDYYGFETTKELTVEFDSNEARRVAQLGKTLFITGGQVMQFDGRSLVELGFHQFPWGFAATQSAGAGNLGAGTYTWVNTVAYENAHRELERSTSTKYVSVTLAASKEADTSIVHVRPTLKASTTNGAYAYHEVWRNEANAAVDSAYYLVTSKTPATVSGDNCFIFNQPTTTSNTSLDDNYVDATLTTKEAFPENGQVLESIAPPPATVVAAGPDRLFLAGIAGYPNVVWPSKLRTDGELPAFHDGLPFSLPATGGDITALAFSNNTLIVFKETAIYAMPGDGLDNLGGGQNFGPPQLISSDVGAVSADVVAVTQDGIFFQSSKGWYLLNRGLSTQYVGAAVEDYNTDTFTAVHVLEQQHQIRCFSTSRVLTYDYLVGQWSEWEIVGSHATLYNGTYHYCSSSAAYSEASTYTGVDYSLQVKTAPIKLDGLWGYQRVRWFAVIGEYRSAHDLKVELFKDYEASAFQTKTWTVSPTTVANAEVVEHKPSQQKYATLSVRLTDRAVGSDAVPSGESLKLTGLTLEVGIKKGLARLPAAQKQ